MVFESEQRPSIGNLIGQALASGFGRGEKLAKEERSLSGLLGDPSMGKALAGMDPQLQQIAIKSLLTRAGDAGMLQEMNRISGMGQQPTFSQQAPQQQIIQPQEQQATQQPQQSLQDLLGSAISQQYPAAALGAQQQQGLGAIQQQTPIQQAEQPSKSDILNEKIGAVEQQLQAYTNLSSKAPQNKALENTIANTRTALSDLNRRRDKLESAQKEERKQIVAEKKEERRLSAAEQKSVDAETKPYYVDLIKADTSASESEKRLNRMSKLIDKGDLPISTFYKLFKNIEEKVSPISGAGVGAAIGGVITGAPTLGAATPAGLAVGAGIGAAVGGLVQPVATLLRSAQQFTSPDTDEFEKLSNDFLRDAKGIFGSRITDMDIKAFMSMVPTLGQTDNGKNAIIRNMKNFLEGVHVKYDTMKDVIKENNGVRPRNLETIVEEKSKDKLEVLADRFSKGLGASEKIIGETPKDKHLPIIQKKEVMPNQPWFGSPYLRPR